MNLRQITFVILICFFCNSVGQNSSIDITLVLHIKGTHKENAASTKLEEEYSQGHWENLRQFFISHFSIDNSTTSGDQIRICISEWDKMKSCGSANKEIFFDKLANLEINLNDSFDAPRSDEIVYRLVVVVLKSMPFMNTDVFKPIKYFLDVQKFLVIVLNTDWVPSAMADWIKEEGGMFVEYSVPMEPYLFFPVICNILSSNFNCHATPEDSQAKCQKNVTNEIHEECSMVTCDERKCNCDDMYPVDETATSCSVSCGEGRMVYERNKLPRSDCPKEKTLNIQCTQKPCPTTTTTITTKKTTTTLKTTSTTGSTVSSSTVKLTTAKETLSGDAVIAISVTVFVIVLILSFMIILLPGYLQNRRRYSSVSQLNVHTGQVHKPSLSVSCLPTPSLTPKSLMPPPAHVPAPTHPTGPVVDRNGRGSESPRTFSVSTVLKSSSLH